MPVRDLSDSWVDLRDAEERDMLVVVWIVLRRSVVRRLGLGKPSEPSEYAPTESVGDEPCAREAGDMRGGENCANGISRLSMLHMGVPVDIIVGGRGDAL